MEKEMAVDEVESYPMNGGDGPYSYAQNSCYQNGGVEAAKELVNEAIANKLDMGSNLGFDTSCTFRIADLGCSAGPNTFIAVQNIIEAVEQKYHVEHKNPSAVEFQVFFNDHCDNDFNTLFKTLPRSRKYSATGVPGSFHGRLFPKSSIHFVHSSYALHWLSRIPKEIPNEKSHEGNNESVLCRRFVKEVAETHSAQYRRDIESFLNARAQELVPGGLIVILLSVVPDGIPMANTMACVVFNFIGSCLMEMARMGIISEKKAQSFNLPLYNPSPKELESLIQRNGNFSIERIEELIQSPLPTTVSAEFLISQLRAVFEGLIKEHFGDEFVDQIFSYFTMKYADNHSVFDEKRHKWMDLFIVLKRVSMD